MKLMKNNLSVYEQVLQENSCGHHDVRMVLYAFLSKVGVTGYKLSFQKDFTASMK